MRTATRILRIGVEPIKPILIYATNWAALTAAVRPANGESVLELLKKEPTGPLLWSCCF